MICKVCKKKFFCHCDKECGEEATICYCKACSIKKWGKDTFGDLGSLELCYGGIIDKEKVQFT